MNRHSLIVIAGANGSGKSTLKEHMPQSGLWITDKHIDPDVVARNLKAEYPDVAQSEIDKQAQRLARSLRAQYRDENASHSFETVFSHPSSLLDMQRAKQAGYEVTLVFVATSNVEINVARVKKRVAEGGHSVPEEHIRNRYDRVFQLLPRIVEEADRAFVFDGSNEIRLCFRKQTIQTPVNPPDYIIRALINPLEERSRDREEASGHYSLIVPDECSGIYHGPICLVLPNYVVQEDTNQGFILHDRLLYPSFADLNKVTTVKYDLDSATPVTLTS